MGVTRLGVLLVGLALLVWRSESLTLSSRLIHRFSDEAREIWAGRGGVGPPGWPTRGSEGYYRALVGSDLRRQKRVLGGARYQAVFPSEGSEVDGLGNDFGWLHYTSVDIGTPNVSFLVALDGGSDYFWVPCDCIQCATLSGRQNSLGKDLSMYSPSGSSTSKHLSCNHELCASEPSCKSPRQPCPYNISYYTENTSSSGLLVEDILYLASSNPHMLIQASVVIGCGNRQTGGYLDGIAPDGVLGLGPGDISVPTILAREGLVQNSFSLCFEEDDTGRILFGDQGVSSQQSTPFIAVAGKYPTYIVEVEGWCIGAQCLRQTRTKALVDSGSSFSYLPANVYKIIVAEFDRQMNSSRLDYEGSLWEYCYRASSLEMPVIPKVTLMLAVRKSFVVNNPVFLFYKEGRPDALCLTLQQSKDNYVTIGQNIMTGYRMVFDRENMKLGWSHSHCRDVDNSRTVPLTPPSLEKPENPLPTIEEQSPPSGRAVTPAVAGRAPSNLSASAPQLVFRFGFLALLLLLLAFSVIFAG